MVQHTGSKDSENHSISERFVRTLKVLLTGSRWKPQGSGEWFLMKAKAGTHNDAQGSEDWLLMQTSGSEDCFWNETEGSGGWLWLETKCSED